MWLTRPVLERGLFSLALKYRQSTSLSLKRLLKAEYVQRPENTCRRFLFVMGLWGIPLEPATFAPRYLNEVMTLIERRMLRTLKMMKGLLNLLLIASLWVAAGFRNLRNRIWGRR